MLGDDDSTTSFSFGNLSNTPTSPTYSPLSPGYSENNKSKSIDDNMDMDEAIVEIGENEGEFKGTSDTKLIRNSKYPIRVTLQYYKIVNKQINPQDIDNSANQLLETMSKGFAAGSLVLGNKFQSNFNWTTTTPYIPKWWDMYWLIHGSEYNCTKEEVAEKFFSGGMHHMFFKSMSESQPIIKQIFQKLDLEKKPPTAHIPITPF